MAGGIFEGERGSDELWACEVMLWGRSVLRNSANVYRSKLGNLKKTVNKKRNELLTFIGSV